MSTFVPATNCAKVAVEGTWSGQSVIWTLWFTFGTSPSQSDLEALAQDVWSSLASALQSSWASTYQVDRITATRQNSANDIQGVYDNGGTPLVGSGAGSSVPLNVSWVASFRTALRGRSFRGRNYIPGLLSSILTAPGTGSAATLAGIAAAYVLHLITSPPTGWTWVVASHFTGGSPRANALLTPITSVIIDTFVDSMRRRLIGRGT
jgi:hypothetical protein